MRMKTPKIANIVEKIFINEERAVNMVYRQNNIHREI